MVVEATLPVSQWKEGLDMQLADFNEQFELVLVISRCAIELGIAGSYPGKCWDVRAMDELKAINGRVGT